MSMNLYQTGVSGLLASQQQLATTGHNIANVNTEGYNRQRVEQNTAIGNYSGDNFIGSGTYVTDISRIYDQFAYKEQLLNQSNLANADARHMSLNQLNEVMSYSGTAVMTSMEQFYQSVNSITDNPSDLGLRSIALSQANVLSSNFNSLAANIDQMEKSVNGEIEQMASQISQLSVEIANINQQILQTGVIGDSGQPNDLLDKRDQLVNQLGELTSVNTIEDANGVMTVMIGQGNTLVAGVTALTIGVSAGDPDPNQTELQFIGTNGTVALDGSSLGGAMGAKFDFRDNDLAQVRREIDRLAMAISETLNAAQADGLDLNQIQGADIFTDINTQTLQEGRSLSGSANTGGVVGAVNITDVSLVPTDEFEITVDAGGNYVMTNLSDQSTTVLGAAGAGTYATAFGFEFDDSSVMPAPGDSFLIRPTANSAALMEVTMTDGASIAASSAVSVTPSANNISAGKVEITGMSDPVNARLAMQPGPVQPQLEVLENPPGTYTYTYTDNAGTTYGPTAYTPPSATIDISAAGPVPAGTGLFTIEISGTPSGSAPNAPETFVFGDAYGIGNGSNALAMASTQEQSVLNGGQETFSQSLSISTADVGSKAKSAELMADSAQSLFTQAFNRNQSTSGVNLDEEAANLLRYQQAYQASSQIITVASTIFDTLLSVAR